MRGMDPNAINAIKIRAVSILLLLVYHFIEVLNIKGLYPEGEHSKMILYRFILMAFGSVLVVFLYSLDYPKKLKDCFTYVVFLRVVYIKVYGVYFKEYAIECFIANFMLY